MKRPDDFSREFLLKALQSCARRVHKLDGVACRWEFRLDE
jgi:hypothetical protein